MDEREAKQMTVLAGATFGVMIASTAYYLRLIRKQNEMIKASTTFASKAIALAEEGHFIMKTIMENVEPTAEQSVAIAETIDMYKWEQSLSDLTAPNS